MSERGLSRRRYLTTVGGAAVTLSVAGCSGNDSSNGDERTITAGTAPGFPPFEMKEGGELVGFDVDLLTAVVEQTDYTLSGWEEFKFDSLTPALLNNNIDVIAAGLTIGPDRDENIDFSDPYYSSDQAIVVRSDGSFSPGSLPDLADRTVGAQKGTTGESTVQDELVGDEITENQYNAYGNYVLAIQDLENGNVDAVVIDVPVANSFAANRPVEVAFVYETGEKFGFGVREGDEARQSALNEGLGTVRESGTYEELTQKWFGE
ncbi:basic amino acid ABC transporter substrate-binding protein [Haloarcula sp. S1CR25-12]|uniref:Basic amino acid ABC transporter substrate-binding protein n=1 Tax=Haloarcula saliterrae TaxID=2950534 RepID=A0ABU2FC61_9EURY|nr:basic amino acid ABC transporter substrate-binding protein [Haloarcula sp. S1CR25-12]MDS0259503.1 basic amino acid ABC transporter substrate-binding protein [Haloarcula sp. S1CR25-12]